ncbi:MAG: chromosome partitioning protein [Blastopirellula sp.]|nr:MAG: chromosome partitioning protein [Blastopirellula sp.]
MAKRKRLTPANPGPDYSATGSGLETKAMFPNYPSGVYQRPQAPIADIAADAATRAALDELSDSLSRARAEGRMVLSVRLKDVQQDYLMRDRIAADPGELAVLVASLRQRGQQAPIEVVDLGDGQYGLISGWRRCQALIQLRQDTDDPQYDTVLVLLRQPSQSADAYLAMVEENEIRVGLSYYERARIVEKAVHQGVFSSRKSALATLFGAASRSKRSKIKSFTTLVVALDGALRFPEAIGERAGLALAQLIADDPQAGVQMCAALNRAAPQNARAEIDCLLTVRSTTKKPRTDSEIESAPKNMVEPVPGVWMTTHANGSLTLSGKPIDPALRRDLLAWLSDRF